MNPRLEALARAFADPVSGPTYRPLTRGLALALVASLLGWAALGLASGAHGPLDGRQLAAVGAVALVLLWPMPSLLFGRTVVDANGVRQLGWMGRDAAWSQVQRVRFVRVPMAPRLVVSMGVGRVRVFHSGSAELDAAFERAARLLTAPAGPATAPDAPEA